MAERSYRYFALPDPADEGKISFWYMPDRGCDEGQIKPWPPQRNNWGKLYKKDVPAHLTGDARRQFVRDYFRKVGEAREVVAACLADSLFAEAAAARFARYAIRCCCCGKALTEERSVTYGIGPECRQGQPPHVLSALIERVKKVYAEAELEKPA